MDIKIKRFLLLCCTFTLSVTTYGFGMQGVANGQPAGNGNGNHAGNQQANVVAPRHTRLADFMHRAVDGADNWCIKPCLNVPSAIKRHLGLGWRWAKRVIVNPLYEKIMRNQNVVAYVISSGIAYVLTTAGYVYVVSADTITGVEPNITFSSKIVVDPGYLCNDYHEVKEPTGATCPVSGRTIVIYAATQLVAYKLIRKLFSKIFPAQQNPAANNNAAAAVNGAVNGNNGNNH